MSGQGYPPPGQPGGYPPSGQPGGYPPPGQQGGYPSPGQPGGYPPPGQQAGGYPPPGQSGGYPPPGQQGGYPPGQGQPPQHGGYPPTGNQGEDSDGEFVPQDMSGLQTFAGYEGVGFGQAHDLPPPPLPQQDPGPPPDMTFGTGADITKEEAREAMLQFVAENCCYGKGAAEQMTITDIKPSNAFHLQLETFCEGRTTGRREIPYHGGYVDGPFNGPPPMPWAIHAAPSHQFSDEVQRLPVPHTDEIRRCGRCGGDGQITCCRCGGSRRVRCNTCGGDGRVTRHRDGHSHQERCNMCGGDGRRTCMRCGGDGRVRCPHCEGSGQVKSFIQLTVSFKNHVTDYVLEVTDMPDDLVKSVAGVQIFEQTLPQVWPIVAFTVPEVNHNSIRLVEQAKQAHTSERQLNQRQTLRVVPVSEVDYTYKEVSTRYWVYGMQRKVYAPDYPQQCCWGCNIL